MQLPASVILSDRIWGSIFVAFGVLILARFSRILGRLTEAPKRVSGSGWYARSMNDWVDRYHASRFWRSYDRLSKFMALGGLAAICLVFGLRTLLLMNEPPIKDSIWLPH